MIKNNNNCSNNVYVYSTMTHINAFFCCKYLVFAKHRSFYAISLVCYCIYQLNKRPRIGNKLTSTDCFSPGTEMLLVDDNYYFQYCKIHNLLFQSLV